MSLNEVDMSITKKGIKLKTLIKSESDLVSAALEMAAHHRGKLALKTRTLYIPKQIDVASLHKNFGLTQKQFSDRY